MHEKLFSAIRVATEAGFHLLRSRERGVGVKMIEKPRAGAVESSKMGRIGNRPYWVLSVSILIRAVHLVGAAVFLTAFLLDRARPPSLYVWMAAASGVILLVTEWIRHRQILRELAGVSTLVKLLLLGAAFHGFFPTRETVLLVFVLAAVASHAPKLVRHRLLF